MKIQTIKVGILQTNCYIINNNNECLIIDPGDEPQKIINSITKKVVGIIITHYHFDHIGALEEIKTKYNALVYDYQNLSEGMNKISTFLFECINTPGHKSDSISLLFGNNLFCGDFIFKNSLGRWDLPTGRIEEMQASIKKIIKKDQDLIIHPGHGDKTTYLNEKDHLLAFINQ